MANKKEVANVELERKLLDIFYSYSETFTDGVAYYGTEGDWLKMVREMIEELSKLTTK